ncbi:MAG: winged helix-turn-helix domain-containing protein [Candidatus Bathyarchaeota archaeon]|nr:winged helix-turn-helix domain-containing protein [Candidatus Bathyarchaeota archaeon]
MSREEIYSTMFTSLKHPIRRKILRILADKPLTFSEMLELLGVSSSNLTYHLESLGELVTRDDSGVYRLSTFGSASVSTMRIVEEAPEVQPKRRIALSFKWKTILGILLIGTIVFASVAALQFGALNQATSERDTLQSKYNQLLSWSASTENAITFLRDVAQIDTAKYQATLLRRTVEQRADLGGALEETMTYELSGSDSLIDVFFRFRNGHLSRYQMIPLEGTPTYSEVQPRNALDAAKNLLDRLGTYENTSYLEGMNNILALVKDPENIEIKQGNIKLNATFADKTTQILMMYTENGVDFSPKSLNLVFQGSHLMELTDGWFLFTVGSTTVNVSGDKALELATNALKGYSWNANGETVSSFKVLPGPVVVFHPNTKNSLALYPQWVITFYLDKVYAGNINTILVEVWADTGEIALIKPQSS